MRALRTTCWLLPIGLAGCAADPDRATLAELQQVEPDVADVRIADSLERAESSYRAYLEKTPSSVMTPEAMRRLADLQIEKEFGIIGSGEIIEMAAGDEAAAATARTERRLAPPEQAAPASRAQPSAATPEPPVAAESLEAFERRASAPQILPAAPEDGSPAPADDGVAAPAGPLEAIETYRRILAEYPNYERADQVLYQMSRAYDELGQPDEAMQVMQTLVEQYPYSPYTDEVYFRRGEYFFVRRKYREAEDSYGAIIAMGPASAYYELGLYKKGWALYKQQFYEEALQQYIAMLDHRDSMGFDFETAGEDDDEHRVADTFRVISLSFSNLGGPEVIDEYFAAYGQRSYAHHIYSNLGEFYLDKLRYQDAAAVYRSFIELNPYHRVAPYFSMRVVQIYEKGEFPRLVVDSKKEFATRYALYADYWKHFDPAQSPEVMGFLKTNLDDLATHYHALYQNEELVDERPANYQEALTWYREFLASFPRDTESPSINYRLADLLFEEGDFATAATEYERTAYDYAAHEQAAAAGYAAVYAHRENLKAAAPERQSEVKLATVESSLRFAETFPGHEQAPAVLGAAADDLYDLKDFARAIVAARSLIERYPGADAQLLRSAWVVVAHSSLDVEQYADAEQAYSRVLELTAPEDETRGAIVDGLAASIYKQGEEARQLEDYRTAADHFLRIRELAPTSAIASSAQYDAATALVQLEDWSDAAQVLERFRGEHADHELAADATKQLAYIYREDGQLGRSATEHERIADESDDPEIRSEALLVAADLHEKAGSKDSALATYERYVREFPEPLETALEIRTRIAELYEDRGDLARYHEELRTIVASDREAGGARTARTRFLAAKAGLVLAELVYERFAGLELKQPFEQSLAEKQARMDAATAAFEELVGYEVGAVTAAATYYLAEIYLNFSASLVASERPSGLSKAELADYELVIEEEAYPFEEQAIAVHEKNFELLAVGMYNPWVQKSLEQLAVLMPGRYAKGEISSGFVGSIDYYVYRMPIVPEIVPGTETPEMAGTEQGMAPEAETPEGSAQVTRLDKGE